MKYLKKKEYDLILVMGYSLPTEILSVIYLHHKRIPFVLCFDGTVPKQTSAAKNMLKKYLISKASYFLSTGEATDEYMATHYILADSIPGGEYDPIWCWKKNLTDLTEP